MTYKTAYKILNQSGAIDTIINEETQQGENLNIVKKEIIDGIQYFTSFIKESSFRKMGYWWNNPENIHQRITQRICKELALYQMGEIERDKTAYEYMINGLQGGTNI